MSNVDYNIKILTPSLKNALALPEQNFIPLEIKSKRALLEPDKIIKVIDAFEQTNIERNEVKKYRINGKLNILTDNNIIPGNSLSGILPQEAWDPTKLDNTFLYSNWAFQITYPRSKDNTRLLNTAGYPQVYFQNPVASSKAYQGFHITQLIPYSTTLGPIEGLPQVGVKYKVLVRTSQKHGVENIGDFIYLSPQVGLTAINSYQYLGYHRVLDFEVGNEDYGLVLDLEYIIEGFGGIPTQPSPFFALGKTVFQPSADDIVFLGSKNITTIRRSNRVGDNTTTPLEYIKIYSEKHGLKVNDFIELRNSENDPINNLYKIVSTPNINEFVIQYEYDDTTLDFIDVDLNYRFCDGTPSEYYYLDLEVITELTDFEIYNAGFSINVFDDPYSEKNYLYHFNGEIDLENLRDNLNRPISELYLTITKRAGVLTGGTFNGTSAWSDVYSILDSNKSIQNNNNPYDINNESPEKLQFLSFWNNGNPANGNNPNTAGSITKSNVGDRYIGDFVTYNRSTLTEKTLSNVLGRAGIVQAIKVYDGSGNQIDEDYKDYDGYTYQLHNKFKIRDFSDAIETVPNKDNEIYPDYAQINNDGTLSWKDLLTVGFLESSNNKTLGVDYPFVNGKHYLYVDTPIYMRRQLPTQIGEESLNRTRYVKFDTDKTPNDEC